MRAVTLDWTVFSSAAARFMPPVRATASNTCRLAVSIWGSGELSHSAMAFITSNRLIPPVGAAKPPSYVVAHRALAHMTRRSPLFIALGGLIAMAVGVGIG